MSIDLADLGRIICQDSNNRVQELNTIRSESYAKFINDRNELRQLADDDWVKLQEDRKQIWKDTVDLLVKCREERTTLINDLKDMSSKNNEKLKAWTLEQRKGLKGWYESGAYLLRKRTWR